MQAIVEQQPEAHRTTEQYLAAIYVLEKNGGDVIQARVAERVGHSAPTVSEMVHRLKDGGYLTVQGREISLTPSGRDLAEKVLRKHCLAARLMTDIIGMPWHLVHDEADRWEHVISDDVAERLTELLDNPSTCPHGCPIPGSCAPPGPVTILADATVGQTVRLARLLDPTEFSPDALAYLEEHDFLPGTEATVLAEGPDGSLVLGVGEHKLVMGAALAGRLCVTPAA